MWCQKNAPILENKMVNQTQTGLDLEPQDTKRFLFCFVLFWFSLVVFIGRTDRNIASLVIGPSRLLLYKY